MLELIAPGLTALAIACAPGPAVEQRLSQEHGEKPLMQLAQPSGGILLLTPAGIMQTREQPTSVTLWVNQETGSWSIVAEVERNNHWCLVQAGKGLDFSPKPKKEGQRS